MGDWTYFKTEDTGYVCVCLFVLMAPASGIGTSQKIHKGDRSCSEDLSVCDPILQWALWSWICAPTESLTKISEATWKCWVDYPSPVTGICQCKSSCLFQVPFSFVGLCAGRREHIEGFLCRFGAYVTNVTGLSIFHTAWRGGVRKDMSYRYKMRWLYSLHREVWWFSDCVYVWNTHLL